MNTEKNSVQSFLGSYWFTQFRGWINFTTLGLGIWGWKLLICSQVLGNLETIAPIAGLSRPAQLAALKGEYGESAEDPRPEDLPKNRKKENKG